MGARLPSLSREEIAASLRPIVGGQLPSETIEKLHAHYQELRRWNPRLSLIGPGTVAEVLTRHYGESLAALPWLPADAPGTLADLGSGAGFPGWILAAARPDWEVVLVEARERKWAFLQAASRRARLSLRCLNARVGPHVPEGFPSRVDVLTLRALKLPADAWGPLLARLRETGRVLWWAGEEPEIPEGLETEARERLPGAARRYLWVARRRQGPGAAGAERP